MTTRRGALSGTAAHGSSGGDGINCHLGLDLIRLKRV